MHRCPVGLVALLSLCFLAYPQTSPDNPPTFRSKVRMVLVDVVVTGDKDAPITGLEKKDFKILEDGNPQTIAFFEEHQISTTASVKLPPLPPHVFTNISLTRSDSVNVLLLDWLNTQPPDQIYVRAQVEKYLKQIPPGTALAVFILDKRLRMVQGVTTDSAALLAALEDQKNGPTFSSLLLTDQQNETDRTLASGIMSPEGTEMAVRGLEQSHSFTQASRFRVTLEALQQLAKYLDAIPGRKNLIWFSGSFPVTLFPPGDLTKPTNPMHQYKGDLQQTADLLTPGQVAIYPIAAQGLKANSQYDASRTAPPSLQEENLMRSADQIAMEELAKDTGGRAFYNTNGLSEAMAGAINDGARYYTIAYSPTNRIMDGKYRHIEVKLVSANYKVSFRRGYYADDVSKSHPPNPSTDPVLPMMTRGLPDFSEILYKIKVTPVDQQPGPSTEIAGGNSALKRPVTRYGVDFAIAAQDIKLETTSDGLRRGSMELMMVAYDHDGHPVNWVIRKPAISLDAKLYAVMLRLGLQFHEEIDVPQGEASLRTGVYDAGTSKIGTLGVPVGLEMRPAK